MSSIATKAECGALVRKSAFERDAEFRSSDTPRSTNERGRQNPRPCSLRGALKSHDLHRLTMI